jgi:hypothetical protein
MKTKEQIIADMCFTFNHGYGLPAIDDSKAFFGMTQKEKDHICTIMNQLFNCVAPIYDELADLKEGRTIQIPVDIEHATNMIQVANFYISNTKR